MATTQSNTNRWQDWANLALAVWLFVSPWILQFAVGGVAAWNAWIFGVVVAVIALAALARAQPWEEWINLIVGIWLIISPWVLTFAGSGSATWNFVIVGALMLIFAAWELRDIRQTATA